MTSPKIFETGRNFQKKEATMDRTQSGTHRHRLQNKQQTTTDAYYTPKSLYSREPNACRSDATMDSLIQKILQSIALYPKMQLAQMHEEQESSLLIAPAPSEFIPALVQHPLITQQQQQQHRPFMPHSTDYNATTIEYRRNIERLYRPRRRKFFRASLDSSALLLLLPLCTLVLIASAREPIIQGQRRPPGGRILLLVDTTTTTTTRTATNLRQPYLIHTIRGGAIDDSSDTAAAAANLPDSKQKEQNNDNNNDDNVDDSDDQTNDQQQQQQANNKFWPVVGDLFRLYDDVKGEALSLEQQLQGLPRDDDVDKQGDDDALNRGRGGAAAVAVAVAQQQQQQQQQPRRFQWFGSSSETFDTTAPLSSRLILPEDENEHDDEAPTEEQHDPWQKEQQQEARYPPTPRWGNVGMQFVPDGVQDSELDYLDEESDEEEDDDEDDDEEEEDLEADLLAGSRNSRKENDGASKKLSSVMNESEALMQAISHLKPDGYKSKQQQHQQDTPVPEAETVVDYTKGAYLTELPLANASMSKEEEAEFLLDADSATAPADDTTTASGTGVSPYISSGIWPLIDGVITAGYSFSHPSWKLSHKLRPIRKVAAHVTGLHGVLSGKRRMIQQQELLAASKQVAKNYYRNLDMVKRRLEAIDRARRRAQGFEASKSRRKRSPIFGGWFQHSSSHHDDIHYAFAFENTDIEETQRRRRVQEIDKLMADGQRHLLDLATEKDILQKRPNPLWTYKTTLEELDEARRVEAAMHHNYSTTHGEKVVPTRMFTFPPKDLVEYYLDLLYESERLVKMNHTELWRSDATNADDLNYDDDVYDDVDEWFFGASSAVPLSKSNNRRRQRKNQQRRKGNNGGHYYYGNANHASYNSNNNNDNDEAGSFWLRNGIGEKIGVAVEEAAYKAICQAVMSFLARLLSSLHGINVMTHSDIRLYTEDSPELPGGDNEESRRAQREVFSAAMRRGAKVNSKKRRKRTSTLSDFIQRDAVVETLLSQSQIAAPLLKVFPLNWQRALLGNIVTLVTCVISDFVEGLEFQILGHRLSFAFAPITEEDMIRHLHMVGTTSHGSNNLFYHRRYKSADGTNSNHSPERFEEAVRATARDLSLELKFLDKWHERALGGDMLKTQIATLIARLVLSLVDEILCGARMDLWTTHAGGPRLVAGLEYRHNNTAAQYRHNNNNTTATIPGAIRTMATTATITSTQLPQSSR